MHITYENTLLNKQLNTTAYNSYKGNYGTLRSVDDFLIKHPLNSTDNTCYFDPNDSKLVVFTFDVDTSAIVGEVFGAVFMFVGMVSIIIGIVIRCKNREIYTSY